MMKSIAKTSFYLLLLILCASCLQEENMNSFESNNQSIAIAKITGQKTTFVLPEDRMNQAMTVYFKQLKNKIKL